MQRSTRGIMRDRRRKVPLRGTTRDLATRAENRHAVDGRLTISEYASRVRLSDHVGLCARAYPI
jgi:hypothetical protein